MLGHLGDYSVPESSQSVHLNGKPIIHSTHSGFGRPPICFASAPLLVRSGPFGSPRRRVFSLVVVGIHESAACGVAHNEQPLSWMWRTHGARGKHAPFRIEPESGQVTEDIAKPGSRQSEDVFHEHEVWS